MVAERKNDQSMQTCARTNTHIRTLSKALIIVLLSPHPSNLCFFSCSGSQTFSSRIHTFTNTNLHNHTSSIAIPGTSSCADIANISRDKKAILISFCYIQTQTNTHLQSSSSIVLPVRKEISQFGGKLLISVCHTRARAYTHTFGREPRQFFLLKHTISPL